MYPAIGTIPAIVLATVIAAEPNASIVRFLILTARVVVQVQTRMSAVPVIMSTVGAGGITTMVKAKLLDVVVVVIIVIAPPPVVVGKMATITTVDTVTRTTETPHCVANVPLPAIGMTQRLVPVPMVIVVVPSTKNARYPIRTRSADVPVPNRM
jgi:NADH:ubiquinone oxidoreductase subunit 6 (subunit J)